MSKKQEGYCVYSHSIDGNIFYIGSGRPERPYVQGRKGKDRNQIWFDMVENNNYDYDINIIMTSNDRQECLDLEEELTIKYKKLGMCEANIMAGNSHTKESKKKLSDARMGRFTGADNPFYGRKHSKETIEKIIKANIGKKDSDETNRKKANYGIKNPAARKVVAIFKNEVRHYDLMKDLVEDISCLNASAYARGRLGVPEHYWKKGDCYIYYEDDYIKNKNNILGSSGK